MYADVITESMKRTIQETNRRREKQLAYNETNNITPKQIIKAFHSIMGQKELKPKNKAYIEPQNIDVAADPVVKLMSQPALEKTIERTRKAMEAAAKELDFIEAARLRDEMFALEKILGERK